MVNWEETIDLAGLHRLYSGKSISLQDLAKAVVRKLKKTQAFITSEPEFIDIMCAFEAIDELAQVKDYTAALEMLYDFGDKGNRLWIETENVGPQELDDIPTTKTRNPLNEDEQPMKGPYLIPAPNSEWVKYPLTNIPNTETKEKPIQSWSKDKIYEVGDIVSKEGVRYECIISCANVDPAPNSYNQPGHCWKWLGAIKNNFDPALILTDRLTCSVPTTSKVYPATRKYHYMSEDDFNKKLISLAVNPANVPKELYSYMKDCEEPYQNWLIERWHKHNLTFRIPTAA